MPNWNEEEQRFNISSSEIENCIYKALAKFKIEEKINEEERFRLHQAECPAFQGDKFIKFLIGLPIISTIVVIVHHYCFTKK